MRAQSIILYHKLRRNSSARESTYTFEFLMTDKRKRTKTTVGNFQKRFKARVKNEGLPAIPGCLLCEKATQLPFLRGNATSEVTESCCILIWIFLRCFECLYFSIFFFWHRVSCSPGWFQTHYVAEAGPELQILLLLLPTCWDYTVYVTMSNLFLFLLVWLLVYTKSCYAAKTGMELMKIPLP